MAIDPRFDLSRYRTADSFTDAHGDLVLEEREPWLYEDRPDNIPHIAKGGQTWGSLAQHYYWDLAVDAAQLYWVIMDFQPTPVINPFAPIAGGTLLIIPAPEYVKSDILELTNEEYQ